MKALLFPGQGSQRVGMGRDLAREFDPAKQVFEEADDILGFKLSAMCFEGPEQDLLKTEYTQPAILANSVAVFRTLRAERGIEFDIAAGHSLGEWSALVAVGALSFADAVRLVHLRGKAMQDSVPRGEGAMAAIIGMDDGDVSSVCADAAEGEVVSPANLNGAGQTVISGHARAVERAMALAKDRGARRVINLQVSAPFHCALMEPAALAVRTALEDIDVSPFGVSVVSNVEATPNRDASKVKDLLVAQVTSPVRWEESMHALVRAGVTSAVELGSGSVLRGLARRVAKDLTVVTIGEPHEIRDTHY